MPQKKGHYPENAGRSVPIPQPERVVAGLGVPGSQSIFTGSVPRESHRPFVWFFIAQFVGFGTMSLHSL
jgi:hypothetical protein